MIHTDIENIKDVIKMVPPMIDSEIGDSKEYVIRAMETRVHFPDFARLMYELSMEEMDHMSRIHTAAANLIEAYRNENGEPPTPMMAVYNYLHDRQIENAAAVKALQSMYESA